MTDEQQPIKQESVQAGYDAIDKFLNQDEHAITASLAGEAAWLMNRAHAVGLWGRGEPNAYTQAASGAVMLYDAVHKIIDLIDDDTDPEYSEYWNDILDSAREIAEGMLACCRAEIAMDRAENLFVQDVILGAQEFLKNQ